MLAVVVGFILALCIFGIPLAIIALFIQSVVDRWDTGAVETKQTAHFADRKRLDGRTSGPPLMREL
jgi:hypothetical protein